MLNPEQFAAVLEELTKQRKYQEGAWALVVSDARHWARMKAFGTYIDMNGHSVRVSHSEVASRLKYYESQLMMQIEHAFAEDALMGAAMSELT